jgi:hypothetical protein
MPLILPGNVGSATAATGYDVDNSARFQTASLKRSAGSKTNATQATISMWFKRSDLVDCVLMQSYTDDNNRAYIKLLSNTFYFFDKSGGTNRNYWVSTFVLRDISAWYHLHINIDTGNGTAANRFIVHLNGVNQPVANFTNNASYGDGVTSNWQQASGTNQFTIGANESVNDQYFGGYMSEVVYLDGQVVAYDSFGEFDEDSSIWKPIDGLANLTPGSTGFYLDYKDSSALGADVIGSNDFTAAGLAATDQSTDTCTNNFATLNPLNNYWAAATFSEGNLVYTSNNTEDYYGIATSTIGVASGKWYFEAKTSTASGQDILGITSKNMTGRTTWLGSRSQEYGYYQDSGTIRSNAGGGGSDTSYGQAYTVNDIIGIYMDLDNNKMYVSDNGVLMNSGTGHTITAASLTDSGFYHFAVGDNSDSTQVWQCNFGGTSGFAISSAVTDDNGFGAFEYSPNITGDSVAKKFYALCTKNLAEFG